MEYGDRCVYTDKGLYRRYVFSLLRIFFFKQKTAYEMRISDWSSDVCSSDLASWASICTPTSCSPSSPLPSSPASPARCTAFTCPSSASKSSEERRVGKGGGSSCRSWWSPYH